MLPWEVKEAPGKLDTDGHLTIGDSSIRATVNLPNPCVAPIIMVLAGSEDKWFAVTGFEAEEE